MTVTPLKYIKGVGEKRAQLLNKLGIFSLDDLVHYFPRSYLDFSNLTEIKDFIPEEVCCFKATVGYTPVKNEIRRGLTIYKTLLIDGEYSVNLNIFNSAYAAEGLVEGEEYLFYGKITLNRGSFEITNPIIENPDAVKAMQPIYPLTAGLSNKIISKIIDNALGIYINDSMSDVIPDELRRKYSLCHESFALKSIHSPASPHDLEIARKRFIFEELLTLQTGMKILKRRNRGYTSFTFDKDCSEDFISTLPFTLTNAQKNAIADCIKDTKKNTPMNRLVQGDVGSGKTVVAAAVIYNAAKNGIQSAFMAPTDILARQHFSTLTKLFESTDITVDLLTGSLTAKKKKEIKEKLKNGETKVIVGTHALISDDVDFDKLGLVITDEQHRFGVRQRGLLNGKGINPHTLVMSATPIPRTISLIIYGDLDLTVIDELPKGRQKISTYAVDTSYRERIYAFIKKHLERNLRAYIVCPLVEENDGELTAAKQYAQKLTEKNFHNYSVGLLHGKMKPKEKEKVMADFASGKIQLLVSTTVIEVGVDVPESVIMVIENAERFGLSQLHQLRGRVGRGSEKSYCILISDNQGENAKARFEIMCRTCDGFKIADKDLELRGPGDFFGSRQSGIPKLKIADLTENMDIVHESKQASEEILRKDPMLKLEENRRLKVAIKNLFSNEKGSTLN
ncbi:MAG: ATP-dependent DNA helicase RecG [Ruminococcaceae bacterium]|nr:ATP-dependent DNA helicase RecG [Oscillospiraceae bacterium]